MVICHWSGDISVIYHYNKLTAMKYFAELSAILDSICMTMMLKIEQVRNPSNAKGELIKGARNSEFVTARQIYCKMARMLTIRSLDDIGETINRDHATVLNAIKRADNYLETDKHYAKLFHQCMSDYHYGEGFNYHYLDEISVDEFMTISPAQQN